MLSFPEVLVILIVAVIVLGPKRLPETARKVGHWMGVFRRASEEFKRELMAMDRVVDDSLNRAVNDIDTLVPEDTVHELKGVEDEIGGAIRDAFAPPSFTPDDLLEMPPVPGGLPPEVSSPAQDEVIAQASAPAAQSDDVAHSESLSDNAEVAADKQEKTA